MLFKQEMKRLFRCGSTWPIMFCAVLFVIAVFGLSMMGTSFYTLSPDGSLNVVTGISAIQERRILGSTLQGEVSIDKLENALLTYQKIRAEYGENIPDSIYISQVSPIEPYLQILTSTSPGINYTELAKGPPEIALNYYNSRNEKVENFLSAQLGENSPAYNVAKRQSEAVKAPFVFYAYRDLNNAISNIGSIVMLLSLIVCVLSSQMFSAEYQSKSIIILRSTRNGRSKLAWAKILSSMLISTLVYTVSIALYTALCGSIYGWDGFNATIQLSNYLSVHAFTYGQVYAISCGVGLLTIWAVTAFTLFVSSCMNAPVFVIVASFGTVILQFVLNSVPNKLVDFLSDVLPSSGSAIYGELFRINYFTVGPLAIWSPYIIVVATTLCVPIFIWLTIKSFCKHETY